MDFDYNEYKVVGYVDFAPESNNVRIEVVGYIDWRGDFYRLTKDEIMKTFPPYGKVFAHNFVKKYNETKGSLVGISVIPNEKIGDRLDAFIWNKSDRVFEFGTKVKQMKGCFSANGQYNYSLLMENGLFDIEHDTFVLSGGYFYQIKADSQERLISYWKEDSIDTINVNGKTFIIESVMGEEDGKIDITTDEQLIDWYLKNVLKKHWGEILEQKTFRNVELLLRDAISVSKGLDNIIVESRIKRLSHINKSLTISLEDLNKLKDFPWLSNSIEQSIEYHKAIYVEEVKKEKAMEFKSIMERYDKEILEKKECADEEKKNLKKQIEKIDEAYKAKLNEYETLLHDKKLEFDALNETYHAKNDELTSVEDSINRLESKKEEIINDFSIIKEVLGTNLGKQETERLSFSIEEINLSNEPMPFFQQFLKSLENTLKINHISYANVEDMGKQIAAFKILLVPDVAIAQVIIMASMRCRYFVEYVNATWKSFEDLWENGLGSIVRECQKNKDLMHFLVLQNINLTYLPNYMMPLIDLEKGILSRIPGTDCALPSNLRIICTITKDYVMPLSAECLQYIGCVDKSLLKEYYGRIVAPENFGMGYLTPCALAVASDTVKDVPNFNKDYLEDE